MEPQHSDKKNGFATLLSVIALTVVSSLIIVATIIVNVDQDIIVGTNERSKLARALADTCAEKAIDKLKVNLAYSGNENITLGQSSCTISSISGTGNTNRSFTTTGTNRTIVKKVSVVISVVDPLTTITSWNEIP